MEVALAGDHASGAMGVESARGCLVFHYCYPMHMCFSAAGLT